ncbi:MAG: hypothetical protein ACR2OU_00995 [Thermomicrobiales bacterium]
MFLMVRRVPTALTMLICACALVGMTIGTMGPLEMVAESVIDPDADSDGDGIVNSHDPDDDNDGITDDIDIDPFNPSIPGVAPTPDSIDPDADSDGDGIKNSHDPDDDNDAAPDRTDPVPFDPLDTVDPEGGSTEPETPGGSGSGVPSGSGSAAPGRPSAPAASSGQGASSTRSSLVTKLPNTGHGSDNPVRPWFETAELVLLAVIAAAFGVFAFIVRRSDGYGMQL